MFVEGLLDFLSGYTSFMGWDGRVFQKTKKILLAQEDHELR
jgi:hypothetical protein